MKRIINLALCFILMTLAVYQPAFATEDQQLTFACQYIAGYNVAQTIVHGEVHDNCLYVKPDVIAELCGMYAADDGKNITFKISGEDEWIHCLYQLDVNTGTLTDMYTMLTGQNTTWNIPMYKADDGTVMVSFEHMLKALNAEVSFDPNSTVPISVYRPYSVIELSRKVASYGHNLFFNWSEIDPNASLEDSKVLYLLSSLNSLILDYNDHFITDVLYSWWTDNIPTANEEQFQDSIYEIMTCFSDVDTEGFDSSVYETFKLQNDIFELTDDMMNLMGVEDEAISALGLSSNISEYGTTMIDQLNTYIQYKNISNTQSEMIDTTFLSSRNNSIFLEESNIQIIRNAAQQLQNRISDNGIVEVSVICDAVVKLSAQAAEAGISKVTPVLMMVDMASTMVKILPLTSHLVDINEAINRATHCDLVGIFTVAELYRISELMRTLPLTQTAELLNDYKQVLTFSLQSSYAVREALIDMDLLDDTMVSKLRDKNAELLEYLTVVQNSSPKCPPDQVECSINWGDIDSIEQQDLVTEAYTETYTDEFGTYVWRIPEIMLSGDDVESINNEIWETLFTGAIIRNHEGIQKGSTFVAYDVIDYSWAVNGNILSLVITTSDPSTSWTDFYVYNVDITTGSEISRDTLLSTYGYSLDDYYKLAEQALGSQFWSGWDRDNENFQNNSFVSWFNDALQKTISQENIDQSFPYINSKGELCIIAKVYSLAGADYYWNNLNISNFTLIPDYATPVELNTHTINVSEDEAYQIACDYWNYKPGDVSSETGFELFVVPEYGGELHEISSTGKSYYSYMLRWLVVDSEDKSNTWMSTCDIIYIDAETGECVPPIYE